MIQHDESHFRSTEMVRNIVIGVADGLTVPFALAAGLAGAVDSGKLIITAGLAEIAAGSIAMGLGGYLAAKTELEHYHAERRRELIETREKPEAEAKEVSDIFKQYGLTDEQIAPILETFRKKPTLWVDFMMRFELNLEKPLGGRGRENALTIGLSYIVGGLIPLAPYMLIPDLRSALFVSIAATLTALVVFGYVKGKFTGMRPIRSAFQTVGIGGLAAFTAFMIARLFGGM